MQIAGCYTAACVFYIRFWLVIYAILAALSVAYGLWVSSHGRFLRSRSPHLGTAACVGLFALDRLVEFVLRERTELFVSTRDADRALAMIIDFVVPSVLMVTEFTLVLSLWLGAVNAKYHDPAQRARLRCRIITFNALQVVATSAMGLLNLVAASSVPSRAALTAATNLTFSAINAALVVSFLLFGLSLRRLLARLGPTQGLIRSAVSATRWRVTRSIIAQFHRASFLLAACLATYTGILLADAAYLIRHHTFRGAGQGSADAYAFTNPFPVLHLYRAAEAAPAFVLLALLAHIAARRRTVRAAELAADARAGAGGDARQRPAHIRVGGPAPVQSRPDSRPGNPLAPFGSASRPRPADTLDDRGMLTEMSETVTRTASVAPDADEWWSAAPPPSSTLVATNGSDRTDTVPGAVGRPPPPRVAALDQGNASATALRVAAKPEARLPRPESAADNRGTSEP